MAGRVSADLRGLATELDTITARAIEWVARDAKKALTAAAAVATGGDGRLGGVGTKGAKLSVRYDFQKGSVGRQVQVRAVGPWQFIEYPRRGGYRIPKRKGRGPNRSAAWPGPDAPGAGNATGDWTSGPITGGAISRGDGPWNRALPGVLEAAGDGLADAVVKVLERW